MKYFTRINIFKWCVYPIKMFLVAHISFYFFKLIVQVNFVDIILADKENWYLSIYAFVQTTTLFILYEGIGKLIEIGLNKTILKNEEESRLELDKQDKRELSRISLFAFNQLLRTKSITLAEFQQLGQLDMKIDQESHDKKWKNTVLVISSLLGILILSFVTFVIGSGMGLLFWLFALILIGLILLSFGGLILYFILIKNLDLIGTFLEKDSSIVRYLKMKEAKKSSPQRM